MTTLTVSKAMQRPLTENEAKAIIAWWKEHQDLSEAQVIAHWEDQLGMPITYSALMNAMILHGLS